MLTPDQIKEINQIIDNRINGFIVQNISDEFFTKEEIDILKESGIDASKIKKSDRLIYQSFAMGLISGAIPKSTLNATSYSQFKNYLNSDKMIPLNSMERGIIRSIERQSFADIKGIGEKYKKTIGDAIVSAERQYYEDTIRRNISEGKAKKESLKVISNNISRELDSFGRSFDKAVQFISHQAYTDGRTAFIERNYGKDAEFYYQVFDGACKICIKNYLTAGIGSEPKTFKLGELPPSNVNFGKKQKDWVTTDAPAHPYCYDDQTEVLTSNGWKYFKDVDIDKDLFLSIDVETVSDFEWIEAVKYISYDLDDYLVYITGDNVDLAVTKDHFHVIVDLLDNSKNVYRQIDEYDIFAIYYVEDKEYDVGYGEYPPIDFEVVFDISTRPYVGVVYDVELKKNHTLFVKRNGKISLSGNCRCDKKPKPKGYVWDDESKSFVPSTDKKVERKSKVKIQFGDKKYEV